MATTTTRLRSLSAPLPPPPPPPPPESDDDECADLFSPSAVPLAAVRLRPRFSVLQCLSPAKTLTPLAGAPTSSSPPQKQGSLEQLGRPVR
jgi:hypothetical protein